MDVGVGRLVFLADLGELGGDGFQFGGDRHRARNGGAEDGEDGAFTGGYCLECGRGEVLKHVGVQLEAVPGVGETF